MSRAFDSYKLNEELNTLLDSINIENILSTNYKSFYNYQEEEDKNRVVSILKINMTSEITINGILSIYYFYKTTFKNNKDLLLYLLSDLKKIIYSNAKTITTIYSLKTLFKVNKLLEELRSK